MATERLFQAAGQGNLKNVINLIRSVKNINLGKINKIHALQNLDQFMQNKIHTGCFLSESNKSKYIFCMKLHFWQFFKNVFPFQNLIFGHF